MDAPRRDDPRPTAEGLPERGRGGLRGLGALLRPPSGVVATAHWLFMVIGELLLLVYLAELLPRAREGTPGWVVSVTAAALVATAALWLRGYLRDSYTLLDSVVDGLTVFLIVVTISSVAAGSDLIFCRTLLRSLRGGLPGKLLHTSAGIALLAGGLTIAGPQQVGGVPRLAITGAALYLVTILFHAFVRVLAGYDQAINRERVLARAGRRLAGRVDPETIGEVTLVAATELTSQSVGAAVALGPYDRLQVTATSGRLDPAVGALLALDGDAARLVQPQQPQARYMAPVLDRTEAASTHVFRITARDELQGILLLQAAEPITPNLRAALESLCSTAGLALANTALTTELTKLAFHDPLTKLANRSLLQEQAGKALARAARSGTSIAILVLDLDGFKEINDAYGHLVGDEALVIVAARLLDCVRDGDVATRLGGDEFAVLLTDLSDPQEATAVARRVIEVLGEPLQAGDHDVAVGVSIGIVTWTAETGTHRFPMVLPQLDDLLREADGAMYEAKSRQSGYEVVTSAVPLGTASPGAAENDGSAGGTGAGGEGSGAARVAGERDGAPPEGFSDPDQGENAERRPSG